MQSSKVLNRAGGSGRDFRRKRGIPNQGLSSNGAGDVSIGGIRGYNSRVAAGSGGGSRVGSSGSRVLRPAATGTSPVDLFELGLLSKCTGLGLSKSLSSLDCGVDALMRNVLTTVCGGVGVDRRSRKGGGSEEREQGDKRANLHVE